MQLQSFFFSGLLIMSGTITAQAIDLPTCVTQRYPNKTIQPQQIILDVPEIAERGDIVPVRIEKIIGLAPDIHVREISLFSEYRKEPLATFILHNHTGAEQLKTRIRIPDNSRLFAVAILSNGKVISGERDVKVTIGGCGGGEGATVQIPKVSC